jgi:mRNA interferase MazF
LARGTPLKRGELWWALLRGAAKTRPVALVSRTEAYARRDLFIVAPVTRRIRNIAAEVAVGHGEGLAHDSVVNCDTLRTVRKSELAEPIGTLSPAKIEELDAALKFALGLE